jgi:hypothetical protein
LINDGALANYFPSSFSNDFAACFSIGLPLAFQVTFSINLPAGLQTELQINLADYR